MDDGFGVGCCESARNLLGVINCLTLRNRSVIQLSAQFFALEQFGDNIGAVIVSPEVMNSEDVRMIQCRRCEGFLLEAAQPVFITCKRGWQYFDGDFAIQTSITGAIDLTHPARPEWRQNFIRSQLCAGLNGHLFNPAVQFRITLTGVAFVSPTIVPIKN